jgi:type I restriction enzyme S subunit
MSSLKNFRFSDVYEMSSGISSKPEQAGHGSPFLSFSTVFNNYFLPESLPDLMDITEKEEKIYSIKEGDVFLTRTSETIDELGMSSVAVKDYPKSSYSGFLKRLTPKMNGITYPKFMAFYLRSKLFRKTMTNNAVLTLRASLNENIFSYLELIVPPYNEQKKIGDLLFDLSQKIELNNRINSELEGMVKLIYEYWFVQFDFPISKEYAEKICNPSLAGKPYKSSGGKMVWNKELKREIPEGWRLNRLSSLLPVVTGKMDANHASTDGVYKFFTCSDAISRCKDFKFEGKAILVAGNGNFSVKWFDGKFNAYQRTYVLVPTNEQLWGLLFFRIKDEIKAITNGSRGSIIKFMTKGDLENISIALPVVEFEYSNINRIFGLIQINEEQNQKLTELRDWLLPMLMNGQVKVK